MSKESPSRTRLEKLFRGRTGGGLTLTNDGGTWTASAEVEFGAQGANGRLTTRIVVTGRRFVDGIEESCQDVIEGLAEAGVETPE